MNLDFNPADVEKYNSVAIQTPPRVLTLQDRPFPSIEEDMRNRPKTAGRQQSSSRNGLKITASPRYAFKHSRPFLLGKKGQFIIYFFILCVCVFSDLAKLAIIRLTTFMACFQFLISVCSLDHSASMDGLLLYDSEVDDSVVIRRQLIRLTRRLMHLEEENNRRSQREMIIYPLMIGYVLFQVAKWFLQNN